MKYITYYRVSTKQQGKSGLGLDAQRRDIDLFLANGGEVVGSYTDVSSGGDNARPEIGKAMAECKRLGATLLVAKLDRLSRRVSFISALIEDKKLNVKVACMPNADKFQLHIYSALAEQEREFISKRTKDALRQAKARGVKLGGLRDKTNERNKALQVSANTRANKVMGIISPLRESGMSYRAIAEQLNEAKVDGRTWYASTVKRTLERL
jgi:DNA invertase Pin-like site-specific DNA recombinase